MKKILLHIFLFICLFCVKSIGNLSQQNIFDFQNPMKMKNLSHNSYSTDEYPDNIRFSLRNIFNNTEDNFIIRLKKEDKKPDISEDHFNISDLFESGYLNRKQYKYKSHLNDFKKKCGANCVQHTDFKFHSKSANRFQNNNSYFCDHLLHLLARQKRYAIHHRYINWKASEERSRNEDINFFRQTERNNSVAPKHTKIEFLPSSVENRIANSLLNISYLIHRDKRNSTNDVLHLNETSQLISNSLDVNKTLIQADQYHEAVKVTHSKRQKLSRSVNAASAVETQFQPDSIQKESQAGMQNLRPQYDGSDHKVRHMTSRAVRGRSRGVEVLAGRSVLLPCDLRPPNPSDPPRLLLWLRAGSHMPIVSIDYRENGGGRVWRDPESSMAVRLKLHLPPSSPQTGELQATISYNSSAANDQSKLLIFQKDRTLQNVNREERNIIIPPVKARTEWKKDLDDPRDLESHSRKSNSAVSRTSPNSLPVDQTPQKYSPSSDWYEDNNVAGGGNDLGSSGGLVLEHARRDDAGLYRCRVDFLQSPSRNVRVNLTVVDPVRSVSINWRNGETNGKEEKGILGPFKVGDNPAFECFANNGWPTASVEWWESNHRVDTTTFTTNGNVQVATMHPGTLTRLDFGRHFTCMGYNSNLTAPVTSTVSVRLLLPVVAVKVEAPQGMVAGQVAEIHCTAWGSYPPPSVTWWLGRTPLTPSNKWVSDDGNVSVSVLRLTPQSQNDGTKLACSAHNTALDPVFRTNVTGARAADTDRRNTSNDTSADVDAEHVGASGDSIELNVNYAPTVKAWLGRSLDGTKVKEGDDVYFECDVRAKPPPHKLTWTHNSIEVQAAPGVLLTNLTLVLQKVTRKSAGRYACEAHNTLGQANSSSITLDIKFAPVCAEELTGRHSVGKHENARVTCSVLANPSLVDFFWTFNNTAEVLNVPRDRYVVEGRDSVVNYTPVTDLDYGTLLCTAKNEIGTQSSPCVFQIVAAGKPGPPHNCQTNAVTLTSLNIACLPGDDGGLNQTFHLQVVLAGGSRVVSEQRSDEPQFFVSHLHPGTSYELRVCSENNRGHSRPTLSFVATLQLVPASESNAEPTRGRGLGTGTGMSVLVMVVIGCVPVAALVLLILLGARAVMRARDRTKRAGAAVGGAERKSSSASTLGEGSVPAPEDDREDAAMLTTLSIEGIRSARSPVATCDPKSVPSEPSPCWCDKRSIPHIAMPDCTRQNRRDAVGSTCPWMTSAINDAGQVPDVQLVGSATVQSQGRDAGISVHMRRSPQPRKNYFPHDPLPPPFGYNQGYLPPEYNVLTSPFRRNKYQQHIDGKMPLDHQYFVNRGYCTLDNRTKIGSCKSAAQLQSSGSFEMESNLPCGSRTEHRGSIGGDSFPCVGTVSIGISSKTMQSQVIQSLVTDKQAPVDLSRYESPKYDSENDGKESCV